MFTTTEIFLAIAMFGAGIYIGLILAMLSVIQTALNHLHYDAYLPMMQAIIVAGRKSPVIKLLLFVPLFAAASSLIFAEQSSTVLALSLIGVIAFFIGGIFISRMLNEPWYNKVMAWRIDQPPTEWQQHRMQWFQLNSLRFAFGGIAFLCFTMALSLASG